MFGTLFRSNSEVVALLAKSMPGNAVLSDVEEYSDRHPCFADGITTDFQSFYRAKGHQVLDMNDRLLGVTSDTSQKVVKSSVADGGNGSITTTGTKAASTKDRSPVLSPRSQHLRKKMEKLKRQLRSTASLEEEGVLDEGSSLEDGPLSLDFTEFEKKRKWWVEHDRGKSTTHDDRHTGGEETDSRSSGAQSSGPHSSGSQNDRLRDDGPVSSTDHNDIAAADSKPLDDVGADSHGTGTKAWFDQSTLELEPRIATSFEGDRHAILANVSVTSKGYLSSSPDPDSSYISLTDHTSEYPSHSIPSARPILSETSFIQPASTKVPSLVDAIAETTEPVSGETEGLRRMTEPDAVFSKGYLSISSAESINAGPGTVFSKEPLSFSSTGSIPASLASPPRNLMLSLLSSIPETPRPHACKIDLGESPSTLDYPCNIQRPLSSPTAKRTRSTNPFKSSNMLNEPIRNILAQLSSSPPLQLTHSQTDPQRKLKRLNPMLPKPSRASTRVIAAVGNGAEVILIESSDDDDSQASSKLDWKRAREDNET